MLLLVKQVNLWFHFWSMYTKLRFDLFHLFLNQIETEEILLIPILFCCQVYWLEFGWSSVAGEFVVVFGLLMLQNMLLTSSPALKKNKNKKNKNKKKKTWLCPLQGHELS